MEREKCVSCDSNCKTCLNSATECTGCNDNHFLYNNNCYECTKCNQIDSSSCKCLSCHEGKYLINFQCKDCDKSCKSCSLQPYNCTSCNEGYYLDKNECFLCYELCETCSSGVKDINNQNCLSCKEGYVLFENNCIDKCPEGYIEKNKICEICDPLCKTRGDNCDHCTSCFDGYYIDEIEFKCKKCNELCKTCLGKKFLTMKDVKHVI